jgi:hypothetical protein
VSEDIWSHLDGGSRNGANKCGTDAVFPVDMLLLMCATTGNAQTSDSGHALIMLMHPRA